MLDFVLESTEVHVFGFISHCTCPGSWMLPSHWISEYSPNVPFFSCLLLLFMLFPQPTMCLPHLQRSSVVLAPQCRFVLEFYYSLFSLPGFWERRWGKEPLLDKTFWKWLDWKRVKPKSWGHTTSIFFHLLAADEVETETWRSALGQWGHLWLWFLTIILITSPGKGRECVFNVTAFWKVDLK